MGTKFDVEDCLCLNLRRSARLLTIRYDEALRSTGLRVTQFQLLAAVGAMQPTAHQPLADRLGVDRTTLTRNLKVLESQRLLRLGAEKGDRRAHTIELTAKGRKSLESAMVLWTGMHSGLMAEIDRNASLPGFAKVVEVVRRVGDRNKMHRPEH